MKPILINTNPTHGEHSKPRFEIGDRVEAYNEQGTIIDIIDTAFIVKMDFDGDNVVHYVSELTKIY